MGLPSAFDLAASKQEIINWPFISPSSTLTLKITIFKWFKENGNV